MPNNFKSHPNECILGSLRGVLSHPGLKWPRKPVGWGQSVAAMKAQQSLSPVIRHTSRMRMVEVFPSHPSRIPSLLRVWTQNDELNLYNAHVLNKHNPSEEDSQNELPLSNLQPHSAAEGVRKHNLYSASFCHKARTGPGFKLHPFISHSIY